MNPILALSRAVSKTIRLATEPIIVRFPATVLVTARWNPFYGLLAGLGIKLYFSL